MASFSLKGALSTDKPPSVSTVAKGAVKQIVPPQITTAANTAANVLNKPTTSTTPITRPSAAAIAATQAAAGIRAAAEQAVKSSGGPQTIAPVSTAATGRKPPSFKSTSKKVESSPLISQPVIKAGFFASLDGLPMWQKILGGLGLIGVVVFGAKKLGKKKV